MDRKTITVWYDKEGDYLEVLFEKKPGYFTATDNDLVMEKIDADGNVIGFSVEQVSRANTKPLEAVLTAPVT